MSKPAFTVKKSHDDKCIAIAVDLTARDWHGPNIKIQASVALPTAEARTLAAEIIALADAADAKLAKKKEAEARRQKWRDREMAAGRMKTMSFQEVFRR